MAVGCGDNAMPMIWLLTLSLGDCYVIIAHPCPFCNRDVFLCFAQNAARRSRKDPDIVIIAELRNLPRLVGAAKGGAATAKELPINAETTGK